MRYPFFYPNGKIIIFPSLDGHSSTFLDHVGNDEVFQSLMSPNYHCTTEEKNKKKYQRLDFSIVLMLKNSYNFDVFICFPLFSCGVLRPTEDSVRSCSALAWSPDDQQLLSASNCRLAPSWKMGDPKPLTFQLKRVAKLGDQLSVQLGVSNLFYIPLFWRFAKGKLQLSGMRSW